MNAISTKPPEMEFTEASPRPTVATTRVLPGYREEHHVEERRSIPAALAAICEDCTKDPMHYVLRSDTGHDGE